VNVTAKADYAIRAAVVLALHDSPRPLRSADIAEAQAIPRKFLDNILTELRTAGIVRTHRGAEGGSALARPAAEITVADILRAVEGPLAAVRGIRPDELHYEGETQAVAEMWIATRAAMRSVLERVTLADLAAGRLPTEVQAIADGPDARTPK
jgi:Rrf2 family protein